MSSVIERVTAFLIEHKYLEQGESVNPEESLLERGVIDSVGVMKLVEFLEETYIIKIEEDDLMPENFDSLKAVQDYVHGKIG